MIKRLRIFITGRVQGVGFRPAVYAIAHRLHLTGLVYNDNNGVTIELQGKKTKLAEFIRRLKGRDKPPLAKITSIKTSDILLKKEKAFVIGKSRNGGTPLSQVTADTAVCRDCLAEMADSRDLRYGYPFINCTNCGPRYSIVERIPYDRVNTTMSKFKMCVRCAGQYKDPLDRRFHAQPVACPKCGPTVWLIKNKRQKKNDEYLSSVVLTKEDRMSNVKCQSEETAITETAKLLAAGNIVAIKGIGGFHLAVNALDNKAVKRLRARKKRDHKPFALMAASIETIKKYAAVDKTAEKILKSPQSPIVLLPKKPGNNMASSVAEGVNTFGFMLCYAPLHHLLFRQKGIEVLVMTSGNVSDEPLICDNGKALDRLGDIADAFLMHDRDICRQVDDSIVHLIAGEAVLLRRSRGYVPTPVLIKNEKLKIKNHRDVFAAGSDLKNTFCFAKAGQLICSEHIGDLEDAEVYRHYIDSVEHLAKLFEVRPEMTVCDLHPGYLSTQYALSMPDVKVIQVQHHWAHIASVLAENGVTGPVIGLAADGTGYGTDGAVWGCECLIASLQKFERFGHLAYYPLAGGDKAGKEAIRPVIALLKKTFGKDFSIKKFRWLLERIEPDTEKQRIIAEQIDKNINTVPTSSLGRVFDAVAAMAGVGNYNHFEAQLPMALEAIITETAAGHYDFELIENCNNPLQLDLSKTIKQIVADVKEKTAKSVISAKFHNCIAAAFLEMAEKARDEKRLNTVALSGGVFCNRYLTDRLITLLVKNKFRVLFNRLVPANDGGISLGQAAIALKAVAGR